MAWPCPYSPIELHQLNPHGFDFGDRVVLPDGRLGTVSKTGFKFAWVDADTGADWKGHLVELRPEIPNEAGLPRVQQLSLLCATPQQNYISAHGQRRGYFIAQARLTEVEHRTLCPSKAPKNHKKHPRSSRLRQANGSFGGARLLSSMLAFYGAQKAVVEPMCKVTHILVFQG